jgi:aspartate racemase
MEQDFYKARLKGRHGIEAVVPAEADREIVHRVIYDELCLGKVLEPSRREYRRIISGLADQGAQGVVLACTEIPMLVGPEDSPVPVFDTTALHARKAAEWALDGVVP